jgi:hypothetical protein
MLKGFLDVVTREQITGWALDTDKPDASLKLAVFANGRKLVRGIADRSRSDLISLYGHANHGFNFSLSPPLSSAETYRLSIRDVETNRIVSDTYLFASPSPAIPAQECRPILLTSTGRCGTTIMMDILSKMPNVTVAGTYPYEIKLLTYYAQAAKVLCSPAYEDVWKDPSSIHIDPMHVGLNPYFNHQYSNTFHDRERLYNFFGQFSTDTIVEAFREIIKEFYKTVASEKRIETPYYFVEKCDVLAQNRSYLKLLSLGRKEILLVRDLRDAYCSAKSFWSVKPDFIGKLIEAKNALLKVYSERDEALLLIRYEDLIERRNEVIESIAAFLAVPFSQPTPPPNDLALFKTHGTSSTPGNSVGRWKRDLTPEEAIVFSENFSDFTATFGYEP